MLPRLKYLLSTLVLNFVFVAFAFGAPAYVPNEVIVKYKDGVRRNFNTMSEIYSAAETLKIKRFKGLLSNMEHLTLDEDVDVKEVVAELKNNPVVEYATLNYYLYALPTKQREETGKIPCIPGIDIPGCEPIPCIVPGWPPGCKGDGGGKWPDPNKPGDPNKPDPGKKRPPVAEKPEEVNPPVADPELDKAYGIAKIGADRAWEAQKGSSDMVVAVIDTGVDYNHEDLSFNMWRNPAPKKDDLVGWDFVHNDNLPFDDHMHGTHCAGTVGAVGGNGKGVSGVTQRVSIMALKFLTAEGRGTLSGAVGSIEYAVDNGAKIISASWGAKGAGLNNPALRDAITKAKEAGVLFVAAAGNDGTDNDSDPVYPAGMDHENILAVAATDNKDDRAYFSNWGSNTVDVGAPGMNVYSTIPGNKYKNLSGTSMAAPHVAGAAALLWSAKKDMTFDEVKAILMDSGDKIEALKGKTVTGKRINVARALGMDDVE